jgi:hypothetical protein
VFNAIAWATRSMPTFKMLFKCIYQRFWDTQRIRVFSFAVSGDIATARYDQESFILLAIIRNQTPVASISLMKTTPLLFA